VNTTQITEDFFSSSEANLLKEKQLMYEIISGLSKDSSEFHDLAFHGAFAKKIFDIIKREGPHTQGFDRMQQSFTESVEKIRGILIRLEREYKIETDGITSSTPEAKAKLSRFIEDLSILKNWLMSHDLA
jgi:hypothetical protein